ncbi:MULTISPECIES: PTS system mannose/fructose/sorbose family transporter subunit IID [unclassified Gilliamella]|uniref:PTS system mannose/fructose/sorbose family transporter subunit IID n=1 Tax=unclassified Gilliamella TaxID=2685620 RepID=UPI00080E802A|nr:PTS system mannose/fructose/sorbose family transporter subunit IID [Gilliamella apicola]OCG57674.1 PTS mannose transporter subunit IID [Gilliamella apicola]OCG63914.1 PTS mannose transporter subunit IID [Gilliamella apicola]OCG71669.1 PTS mannose transporter subunit IID [Gilliamella apicola]OCG72614.1 PTS mannose transporter subunit IID [Gilliamella apicola]
MTEIVQESIDLKPEAITKKDITIAWLRWYYANEIPHSFDRYLAASLMWGLMPILKKLYKSKSELAAAYQRHLLFFNTQITWGGGTISGIMASLESVRADEVYQNKPISIDNDVLYNTKAGLMGALAGIGDAIDSGTIQYIFIAIALPWAQEGLAIGALFPFFAFVIYQLFVGYYFAQLGFKLGRNAATEVVGNKMQMLIEGLSILGLFMMGILAASYIKVSSSLKFTLSGKDFVIQDTLDKILPGALPLIVVMGLYFYFSQKGLKVTRALVGLTIILGVLAAIGIL